MHQSFLIAIHPRRRWRCLGKRLEPLTLGHLFLLRELGSKVLPPYKPEDIGDILLAVTVCSRSHVAARRFVNRCFWWPLVGWFWAWRCRKMDLVAESSAFFQYLNESHEGPPTKVANPECRRLIGSPYEWRLYACMRSEYGMSHQEALDTPISRAACLWAVKAEADGKVELSTASGSVESVIHDIWQSLRERVNN